MSLLAPQDVPGLICFWDFQPTGRGDLISHGPHSYALQEMNGPIARAQEGAFGPHSLAIERGQWLRIPRADCPALIRSGEDDVSVVAWIRRRTENEWQYIAGMWDERSARRQYALFTSGHKQADWRDLSRTDASHQPHGYVSDVGGATPGCKFCFSYATGAQALATDRWFMIGFSYDHREIRVYVDGELSVNGNCNPFRWDKSIFTAGADGPDFTVAQRDHPSWPDYPAGQPTRPEGFGGLLGGLAVYDRALSAEEFQALHQSVPLPDTRPSHG